MNETKNKATTRKEEKAAVIILVVCILIFSTMVLINVFEFPSHKAVSIAGLITLSFEVILLLSHKVVQIKEILEKTNDLLKIIIKQNEQTKRKA